MPGSTTPDGVVFPVAGDRIAPLETWFAQQAGSVQTALNSIRNELTVPPLPVPQSVQGATVQSITATSWANLPNMASISLNLPHPCWVTIVFGAWMVATASDTRASVRVTGATTLSETQLEVGGSATAWGQVLYTNNTTGSRQSSSVRTVRLNAGNNTITARAYRTASGGSNSVNYSTMQVSPIRWA